MLNKVTLIGRIGQTPKTKVFDGGKSVCNFSLATTETYKGEKKTQWHKVQAWGKLAEIAQKYLSKGSLCCVLGKISYREYMDQNRTRKVSTEIVADEIKIIEYKDSSNDVKSEKAVEAEADNWMDQVPF